MGLRTLGLAVICSLAAGCGQQSPSPASGSATPADAKAFLDTANETTLRLGVQQSQAGWVQQTYFLASILQFQFHRAMAQTAGCTLPLNRCSTYESRAAGERLNAMLSMGLSKPWPEALNALTGSTQMDATAILDYFAPLSKWLDEQLTGKPIGW